MFWSSAIFLIICVIVLLIICDIIKPTNFPPGPNWWPVVGCVFDFRKNLEKFNYHHLVWQNYSEKYGQIVGTKMGRTKIITVFGGDVVNEVLTREEFEGRPDGIFFRLRTFGKRLGIVFCEGEFWQKQRKFSFQHLRNFGWGRREMEEKIIEETRDLIALLKAQNGQSVWLHDAFDVSLLNVLWFMMAGERFNIRDGRASKLLAIIHQAFRLSDMSGGILNQMPFLRFIAPKLCKYDQLMSVIHQLWDFLEATIEEHRKTMSDSHQARDLIDAFLQKMQINNDASFSDDQLMSLLLDLFMAGTETTSNTLGFSMVYMLNYPEVQKRIQDEMDEVIGRNRWPTLLDRKKLKFTEATLMEIQRITNIPPMGIAHRAVCDTNLRGYFIPEGTMILASLYSVHMDQTYWKNPFEFQPERFLDPSGNINLDEKFFIPFGHGKRRCLGEALAKANHFLFFTAILHNFRLEKDQNEMTPDLNGWDGITLSPKPFKCRLIARYE